MGRIILAAALIVSAAMGQDKGKPVALEDLATYLTARPPADLNPILKKEWEEKRRSAARGMYGKRVEGSGTVTGILVTKKAVVVNVAVKVPKPASARPRDTYAIVRFQVKDINDPILKTLRSTGAGGKLGTPVHASGVLPKKGVMPVLDATIKPID